MKPTGTIIAFVGALWSGVPNAVDWIAILSDAHASVTSSTDATPGNPRDAATGPRARPLRRTINDPSAQGSLSTAN